MTVSVLLCVATIVTNYLGFDVTALAALAGTSLAITGAWGGFYFWKARMKTGPNMPNGFSSNLRTSMVRMSLSVLRKSC